MLRFKQKDAEVSADGLFYHCWLLVDFLFHLGLVCIIINSEFIDSGKQAMENEPQRTNSLAQ